MHITKDPVYIEIVKKVLPLYRRKTDRRFGGVFIGDIYLDDSVVVVKDDLLGLDELADPGADRILFWDDSASTLSWMAPGNHISFVGTQINHNGVGSLASSINTTTGYYASGVNIDAYGHVVSVNQTELPSSTLLFSTPVGSGSVNLATPQTLAFTTSGGVSILGAGQGVIISHQSGTPGLATTQGGTSGRYLSSVTVDVFGHVTGSTETVLPSSTLLIDADFGAPGSVNLATPQTFTLNGGTGITTTVSGQTISIAHDDNYVPTSRTLTINGTTQNLAANRTWTVTADPNAHTHPASEITAGTFGTGDYVFPANVSVGANAGSGVPLSVGHAGEDYDALTLGDLVTVTNGTGLYLRTTGIGKVSVGAGGTLHLGGTASSIGRLQIAQSTGLATFTNDLTVTGAATFLSNVSMGTGLTQITIGDGTSTSEILINRLNTSVRGGITLQTAGDTSWYAGLSDSGNPGGLAGTEYIISTTAGGNATNPLVISSSGEVTLFGTAGHTITSASSSRKLILKSAGLVGSTYLGFTDSGNSQIGYVGFATDANEHFSIVNNNSGANISIATTSGTVAITGATTLSSTLSVAGLTITGTNASYLTVAHASTIYLRPNGSGSSVGQLLLSNSGPSTFAGSLLVLGTSPVFHDGYHPNADVLTTARTLTIGGTGKSFDGSGNVSWSLAEIGVDPITHTHPASDITTGTFGSGDYTFPGDIIFGTTGTNTIRNNTPDGGDSGILQIASGGAALSGRGAYITLYGNETTANKGNLLLVAGQGDGVSGSGRVLMYTQGVARAYWDYDGKFYNTENATFSGEIISYGAIRKIDQTGVLYLLGGNNISLGANLTLWGNDRADANDIRFRADSTEVLRYDHSLTKWDFKSTKIHLNDTIVFEQQSATDLELKGTSSNLVLNLNANNGVSGIRWQEVGASKWGMLTGNVTNTNSVTVHSDAMRIYNYVLGHDSGTFYSHDDLFLWRYDMQVNGDLRVKGNTISFNSATDYIQVADNSTYKWYLGGNEEMRLDTAGILYTRSNIIGYATVITSDPRLKKNKESINAVNILKSTRGYRFQWKESDEWDFGFMADEVVPELMVKISGGFERGGLSEYLGVKYEGYIPILVEGWKSHETRIHVNETIISKHEIKLTELESKEEKLEKRVSNLEQENQELKDELSQLR